MTFFSRSPDPRNTGPNSNLRRERKPSFGSREDGETKRKVRGSEPEMWEMPVSQVRVRAASPQHIRHLALRQMPEGPLVGRIWSARTVDYKTLKPYPGGLFCESVFGPVQKGVCACGRTRLESKWRPTRVRQVIQRCPLCREETCTWRPRRDGSLARLPSPCPCGRTQPRELEYRTVRRVCVHCGGGTRDPIPPSLERDYQPGLCPCGKTTTEVARDDPIFCGYCGTEITLDPMARRYRLGYLPLATPVAHPWYYRGQPNVLGPLLGFSRRKLESLLKCEGGLANGLQLRIGFSTFSRTPKDFVPAERLARVEEPLERTKGRRLRRRRLLSPPPPPRRQARELRLVQHLVFSFPWYCLYRDSLWRPIPNVTRLENRGRDLDGLASLTNYILPEVWPGDQLIPVYQKLQGVEARLLSDHRPRTGGNVLLDRLQEMDPIRWVTHARRALRMLDQEIAWFEGRPLRKNETVEYRRRLRQRGRLLRRLRIFAELRVSNVQPSWLMLQCLPVLPADLRPAIPMGNGLVMVSDVNKLYQRVVSRNTLVAEIRRETTVQENASYRGDLRYAQRLLQEGVEALIENGRGGAKPETDARGRRLKSLAETLKGKRGRFRRNLLGKRVDYSGRSVIVSGPELSLHQCGLPRQMALTLLQPFLLRSLVGKVIDGRLLRTRWMARECLENPTPSVWLEVMRAAAGLPILLNRAPTLHRLGFQAFQPRIISGRAILLHPLACSGFNADFDGDQMAVHIPLSARARAEAWRLMTPGRHFFSPATGEAGFLPSQDMVLGAYYLTTSNLTLWKKMLGRERFFTSVLEVEDAYEQKLVHLHEPIWLKQSHRIDTDRLDLKTAQEPLETRLYPDGGSVQIQLHRQVFFTSTGQPLTQYVRTTVGRALVRRAVEESVQISQIISSLFFSMEQKRSVFFDRSLDKGRLKDLLRWTFENHGAAAAVELAERLKNLGFRSAAQAGISLGVEDLLIPKEKRRATRTRQQYVRWTEWMAARGVYTPAERGQARIDVWSRARETMKQSILDTFRGEDPLSPLYLMAFSGARGNMTQVRQLVGMRGLMVDPLGRVVEFPIRSNFKEGMTLTEFIISCYGARKGIVDTALRTATAGYLTRRLVDVAHYQVVGMLDCGTRRALRITPLYGEDGRLLATQAERLVGRALARPLPGIGGRNTFLTQELAQQTQDKYPTAWVRSPLVCRAAFLGPMPDRFLRQRYLSADRRIISPRLRGFSLCQRCYGWSLADAGLVHLGEAVGILAAQSIGEPGTQLTMRTFHTGGVFSGEGGSVLRAPLTGWIHYSTPLPGRLARTATGGIGFLSRQAGTLELRNRTGDVVRTLAFPAQVLLLVRQGQRVAEGMVLAEFPPSVAWREGELVLRLLRAPHGGQVLYHRVKQKQPRKEPMRWVGWQSTKFPGWRSAQRSDGLTRIRIARGEVLPVRLNALQFRKGDLIAPTRTCEQFQTLRPHPATISFVPCDSGRARTPRITIRLRGGVKRSQYLQGLYRFSFLSDPFFSFLLRPFPKTQQNELLVCSPLGLNPNQVKVQERVVWATKRTKGMQAKTDGPKQTLHDVFTPYAVPIHREARKKPLQKRFQNRVTNFLRPWKVSVSSRRGVASEGTNPLPLCQIDSELQVPVGGFSALRLQSAFVNKQRKNWRRPSWCTVGSKGQDTLFPLQSHQKFEKGFPPQGNENIQRVRYKVAIHFSDTQFVPSSFHPLSPVLLQLERNRRLRRVLPLLGKGNESHGLALRANLVPTSSTSPMTNQARLSLSDWREPLHFRNQIQEEAKTLFLGATNLGLVSLPRKRKSLYLGRLYGPPLHGSGSVGPSWTGQLLSLHRNGKRLFRRVTEFLLPPESLLRQSHAGLVMRHEAISALRGRAIETGDITSGIPRIEALLEARERTGVSSFVTGLQNYFRREYGLSQRLAVRKRLHAGQRAVLENVQRLYRSNGVVLDDKHVELIVRPMAFGEVLRDPAWHEPLARGELHPIEVLERVNQLRALYNLSHKTNVREQFPRIEYQAVLLGLTKASLLTTSESFLSAASFQETSRVLARAGIRGRTDYLVGLKENLILGTRLPIGTAARHLLLAPEGNLAPNPPRVSTERPIWNLQNARLEYQTSSPLTAVLPTELHWSDSLVYLGRTLDDEIGKSGNAKQTMS